MQKSIAVIVGLIVLVILVLFSATYTVRYNQVAIKATFGQADEDSVVRDPGLHFRLPIFIDKVTLLDTRLQLVESDHVEFVTRDGLQLVVRSFLLWRVEADANGPLRFVESYVRQPDAAKPLEFQLRTTVQSVLARYRIDELLGASSFLDRAEEEIRTGIASNLEGKGIEPVSVGIHNLALPPKTSRAVLERMMATRNVIAQSEDTKGTAEANRIRSEASTKADKIRAFASQYAEEIRARGEEQAAQYIAQMSEEEDLAIFLVWRDTLRTVFDEFTTIVLPSDERPWHMLFPQHADRSGPIPMPPASGADAAEPAGAPGAGSTP